ncbi:MAG: hypothetical protein RLZZ337_2 [Bacteroidota bacterium]|jgi:formylglycine-generating enzyme required for sulfatase activity
MKYWLYTLLAIPVLLAFASAKKPIRSKLLPKNFVYVPAGKVFTKTANQDNLWHLKAGEKNPNVMGLDSCAAFFVAENETTNGEYLLFLNDLKAKGKMEEYTKNLPDTTVWRTELAYNEPYVNYYFQHPAYTDYPVVGISLEQAKAYCSWLNTNYESKKEGNVSFYIPTKKEWIRASRGESSATYPWGGQYLRNSKGMFLANFKAVDNSKIRLDIKTNTYQVLSTNPELSGVFITTPSKSYFPNQFGAYQMVGNVAEIIADDTVAMGGSWYDVGYDIRIESEKSATKPASTIGFRVAARITE